MFKQNAHVQHSAHWQFYNMEIFTEADLQHAFA